jgi:hypothetical protein
MPYNGLNNDTYDGCHEPEPGKFVNIGSIIPENTARVSILQCETKLDTQETETHIEYLPER